MALNPDVSKYTLVVNAFRESARINSDRVALRWKNPGETAYKAQMTYRELERAATAAAHFFRSLGVEQQDRVCFYGKNSPSRTIADLGVSMAGAVPWGVFPEDKPADIVVAGKIRDTETQVVVVGPDFLPAVESIMRSGKTPLEKVILLDGSTAQAAGIATIPFSEVLRNAEQASFAPVDAFLEGLGHDSMYRLVHTSGTTGKPKATIITNKNIMALTRGTSYMLDITIDDLFLSLLTDSHVFNSFITIALILHGARIAYSDRSTFLEDLKQIEVTIFAGVAALFELFAAGLEKKLQGMGGLTIFDPEKPLNEMQQNLIRMGAGLGKMKLIVSGAAPLLVAIREALERGGVEVDLGYGLSQVTPISVNTSGARRIRSPVEGADPEVGSSGKVLPGLTVTIVGYDPETGEPTGEALPPGKAGLIFVKGDGVSPGYFGDEEATAASRHPEFGFNTEDTGYLDPDGFLYVLERAGDSEKLNNGTWVVTPKVAKSLIENIPWVSHAAIGATGYDRTVAVVAPSAEALQQIAAELGMHFTDAKSFLENLTVIEALKEHVLKHLPNVGSEKDPTIPDRIIITAPFSTDNGFLNPVLKLRRKAAVKAAKEKFAEMAAAGIAVDVWPGMEVPPPAYAVQ